MKKAIVFVQTLISLSAFAAPGDKLLLSCQDKFSGLDKIEFFQRLDGSIYGLQYGSTAGKSYATEFNVNPIAFERKKEIELINWYGYERILSQEQGNEWAIHFQDECSGSSMGTVCKEYK